MRRDMSLTVGVGLVAALAIACGDGPGLPTRRARAPRPDPQVRTFDVVIANGRVVDGSGAPWIRADIGIVGDRIAAIGQLSGAARP